MRFVVIGVAGANYYALDAGTTFMTRDRDLFLPPEADTLVHVWDACDAQGLELSVGDDRVVNTRSVVRATGRDGIAVDLTLTMAGFDFESVWSERRTFQVENVEVPVARLTHIVRAKAALGRPKDQLFLATHADALAEIFMRMKEGPKDSD